MAVTTLNADSVSAPAALPLTGEDTSRSRDRLHVQRARRHNRRWLLLWLVAGPGILAMLGENDGPSMIAYAADGAQYGLVLFAPLIPALFAMAYVCQEMCMRVGAVTHRGYGALVLQRYGRAWGWFGAADLAVTNLVTLVGEFVSIRVGLAYFHLGSGVAVALGLVLVVFILSGGRYWRWERIALGLAVFNCLFLLAAILARPRAGAVMSSLALVRLHRPAALRHCPASVRSTLLRLWWRDSFTDSVGARGERSRQGGVVADRYPAIEDHAVIGDLHTVALVATDGTIDWCCMPRFDSPAVFASLLDADRGGCFAIRTEAVRTRQLYMPDSNVLVTRFLGTDSVGEVVDFMVPRHPGGGPQHPGHLLVRRLRSVRGAVAFTVTCRPAFDFGRQDHAVHAPDRGGAVFTSPGAGAELVLRSGHRFSVEGPAATATVTLGPGEGLDLLLEWGGRPEPPAEGEADRLQDDTVAYWRSWLRRSRYQGRYREAVERSALVLKLLVYQPTGALVAAPTTSLPESAGGARNWDYRYTWIRDAALSLDGLMRLGFTDEAAGFMAWLEARCGEAPADRGLQVLYAIDGNPEVPESVLDHLDGYRGSRPVRVGNSAAGQFQLDIYGELMDAVYLYDKHGSPIGYDLWEALGRQLDWLEKHWQLPDDGIWESRGVRNRSTYSAVMTWVAFERAIRIGRERGLPAPISHWRELANSSYQTVQREGWNPGRQAYGQYLGGAMLDASLLVMPLVKFAGPTDRRVLATLDRIGAELVSDSLVKRYETDGSDGLSGSEGTFNLCSFWYVQALTEAGRIDEGRYIFEKMLTHANHVGLFAEEIGPAGDALGNFPQAFTHLALITAAGSLDRALSSDLPLP